MTQLSDEQQGNRQRGLVIISALINFVDWQYSEGLLMVEDRHERGQLVLKFLKAHSEGENYFMQADDIAARLGTPFAEGVDHD